MAATIGLQDEKSDNLLVFEFPFLLDALYLHFCRPIISLNDVVLHQPM